MATPRAFLSAFLGAGLLAAASLAPAQKLHTDEKYGYAVRTIAKWIAVPVAPTERHTVAKWTAPRHERRYLGEMLVHRFDRKVGEPASTEDVPGANPFGPARSYQAWAKLRRRGLTLGEPRRLDVRAPKGVPVTANLYETTGGRGGGWYFVIAIISTPAREYAVEMSCGLVNKRKYRRKFLAVARSFRLLAAAPVATKTTRPLSAREKARRRARENAERVRGWWFLESAHYFIVTNVPRKKKARILDLRRRLETIRKVYERDFPPAGEIEAVSIVRVCKDRESYFQYGGPPGTGGYWNAAAEELVLFLQGEKSFARTVVNHEGFHQYIYYAAHKARPHIWYNEGHADYYGGAELIGSRAVIKPLRWRVDTIKAAVRAGTHVPLKKLLHYSQRDYYRQSRLCYAEGWSLAYFLNRGLARGHPWRRIVPTYFETLKKTGSAEQAQAAAFQGVDLGALEQAWIKFTVKGTVARP